MFDFYFFYFFRIVFNYSSNFVHVLLLAATFIGFNYDSFLVHENTIMKSRTKSNVLLVQLIYNAE